MHTLSRRVHDRRLGLHFGIRMCVSATASDDTASDDACDLRHLDQVQHL